ncbi:MAG: DUF4374 domain-containing protein [Alistipes sp.]|nr:DUF4374 domain-containing protein [Alistipes sp.]MDE6375320.1 DUF4374 domain-containing protein [Alistipes sp.]
MKNKFLSLAAIAACALFAACSNDDSEPVPAPAPDGGEASAYVVVGTSNSAAYLLTSESLREGEISAKGDGKEVSAGNSSTWFFFGDKYLYHLSYSQGQAGTTSAYYLDANGNIQARSKEYSILNFWTYGMVGDYIITSATAVGDQTDADGNKAYNLTFTILDTENETSRTMTVLSEDFLGNKEYVMFSGLLEANGKIYTAVVPMGCSPYGVKAGGVLPGNEGLVVDGDSGTGGGRTEAGSLSGTQYADYCWVAVYDDITFTNPTLIKTDKLSYACGRMRSAYYQTIWAADNGDVYVFSPSYAKTYTDARATTHNSGVMRIKAGATEFDEAYGYVDIEGLSEGHPIYRCWHICEDYFLLQMYTQGYNISGKGTNELAVYKGESKTFTKVTGLPDDISSISSKNPYCEEGAAYISLGTESGENPCVYKIDMATAAATQGITVAADEINAIGKLVSR